MSQLVYCPRQIRLWQALTISSTCVLVEEEARQTVEGEEAGRAALWGDEGGVANKGVVGNRGRAGLSPFGGGVDGQRGRVGCAT